MPSRSVRFTSNFHRNVGSLGSVGELICSLHGMRDVPALWERFLAAQLEAVGFIRGKANPCLFRHESRDILAVVHGDGLMFTAIEEDLKWVHKALERRILLKVVGTIGGDSWDLKELRVLNRVLRWQEWGIAFEADPRHAELLIKALGPGAASRSTPGVKQRKASDDETLPLGWEEVRLFRTHAARANYWHGPSRFSFLSEGALPKDELSYHGRHGRSLATGPVPCGFSAFGVSFPVAEGRRPQRVCGHGLCRVLCDPQVDLWWCPLPGSPHGEALEHNAEMHHVVFRRG